MKTQSSRSPLLNPHSVATVLGLGGEFFFGETAMKPSCECWQAFISLSLVEITARDMRDDGLNSEHLMPPQWAMTYMAFGDQPVIQSGRIPFAQSLLQPV